MPKTKPLPKNCKECEWNLEAQFKLTSRDFQFCAAEKRLIPNQNIRAPFCRLVKIRKELV